MCHFLQTLIQLCSHKESDHNVSVSLPLSTSVVSVEEMDRQQPTSPEEKKVNHSPCTLLSPLSSPLLSLRHWWLPAGCAALWSPQQTVPRPDWRLAAEQWHPKDRGSPWANIDGTLRDAWRATAAAAVVFVAGACEWVLGVGLILFSKGYYSDSIGFHVRKNRWNYKLNCKSNWLNLCFFLLWQVKSTSTAIDWISTTFNKNTDIPPEPESYWL